MSSAPATKEELDFALKVRRALDERAASLPAATADRLAAARRAALARKKPDAAIVLVPALAGGAGSRARGRSRCCSRDSSASRTGRTCSARRSSPTSMPRC
ncbi:hypothetical protein DM47_87 [Burkholderia mallei]|nr:hypothetical protein DM47_87 [Burkholderia mallei]